VRGALRQCLLAEPSTRLWAGFLLFRNYYPIILLLFFNNYSPFFIVKSINFPTNFINQKFFSVFQTITKIFICFLFFLFRKTVIIVFFLFRKVICNFNLFINSRASNKVLPFLSTTGLFFLIVNLIDTMIM
jgi:hypothetical protein